MKVDVEEADKLSVAAVGHLVHLGFGVPDSSVFHKFHLESKQLLKCQRQLAHMCKYVYREEGYLIDAEKP